MPIRINFLAEEQAAEELRRKDPVKRAIMGAVALVGLVVLFIVYQVILNLGANGKLAEAEGKWKSMEKDVDAVKADQKAMGDVTDKLAKLNMLATNRFLWAPVLDSLQQCMPEQVEVTRVSADQSYQVFIPPTPPKGARPTDIKPATSTQRIFLNIQAKDLSGESKAGGEFAYNTFMRNIQKFPYFEQHLVKDGAVRFIRPPTASPDPSDPSKVIRSFELQCKFQEQVREKK